MISQKLREFLDSNAVSYQDYDRLVHPQVLHF